MTGALGLILVGSADGGGQEPGSVAREAASRSRKQRAEHASLTDLLTRPVGTRETARDTGDAHRCLRLVSETRRDVRDAS
jgi:hypothetical protein